MFAALARRFGYIKRPDFFWFPERSSVELAARITAAGPGHRLEVRVDADGKVTFRVTGGADNARLPLADINESRPCPPICPD